MNSVDSTSRTAPETKIASSERTATDMPSGRERLRSSTAARTACEIAIVFERACRMMPAPSPIRPSERSTVSLSDGPSETDATSRTRVRRSMKVASISSTERAAAPASTRKVEDGMRRSPVGASVSTPSSVRRTSAMVRPRAFSAGTSSVTRKIGSREP